MARQWILAAVGAIALAAVLLWVWRDVREATVEPPYPTARDSSAAADEAAFDVVGNLAAELRRARSPAPGDALPRPESLVGTEPDGALVVDAHGRFVADAHARAFFDYFLAATGELDRRALRALIVAEIEARLPADAAAEAIAVLDRYLEFRRRARRLAESGDVPENLGERLGRLSQLRRDVLGDELAKAFFGLEEEMVAADLARREILGRDDLGAAERERLLWEAEQALPEPVREARQQALLPLRLSADEAALRAAGGTDEEIRVLREQVVGAQAAHRLEALDRERAGWQARLASYRAALSAIESDPSLDDEARAERREELLIERFSANARLRVQAIERMR